MDSVDNQERTSSEPQTQEQLEPIQHQEDPNAQDSNLTNDPGSEVSEETEQPKEQPVEETSELADAKPLLKIKEIKYGMTVLINTGNFENIRTHIEVTAEVENEVTEQNHLSDYIGVLREQVFQVGRNEYREVKLKNKKKTSQ